VEKELKEPVNLCDIASNLLLLNQFTNKGNNVSDHPDYYKQQIQMAITYLIQILKATVHSAQDL
jgi:hypothetical protein